MSLPRYESYRDSGVEWLGEVPSHWSLSMLKRVCRLNYGDALAADARNDLGDILVYGSNGPVGVHDLANTCAPVIFVGRKGSCGALKWADKAGFAIDTVYFIDKNSALCELRWLFWVLHVLGLGATSQDTGVPGLARETAYSVALAVPPLPEQAVIAAFLDRETAKIDALVEAQRRLIELLKEKRQAAISHAVTKGLDPTVPMKDSGVEWLGEVPAHWDVAPLKRAAKVLPGFAFPSTGFSHDPNNVRLLRGVNVGVGSIRWEDAVYWERQSNDGLDSFVLFEGDVVLGMDRPWIGDGLRAAALSEIDAPCLLLQRVAAIRPRHDHISAYIQLLFSLPAFFHHCAPEMTGVSVPHISGSQIENYRVALPPAAEQQGIVVSVETQTRYLDDLIDAAFDAIALLQERRAALISAAVTGKIDVRGLVKAETAAAA